MSKNEIVMRRVDPDTAVPLPDRAARVASWIGWHFFEITGVAVPVVFAVSTTAWAWLVSGVVGTGWTVHEIRMARKHAVIKAANERPTVAATSSDVDMSTEDAAKNTGETSVDGKRAGGAR